MPCQGRSDADRSPTSADDQVECVITFNVVKPRCIRLLSPHCVIPAGAQLQKSSGYSTLASTAGWFLMSRFQSRRENSARTKFATERKAFGNIQKLLLSQTLHSNIHCFIVCDLGVPWVEGWTKPDCVEGLKQLMSVGPLKKR